MLYYLSSLRCNYFKYFGELLRALFPLMQNEIYCAEYLEKCYGGIQKTWMGYPGIPGKAVKMREKAKDGP
jgi:hypothetical protein